MSLKDAKGSSGDDGKSRSLGEELLDFLMEPDNDTITEAELKESLRQFELLRPRLHSDEGKPDDSGDTPN